MQITQEQFNRVIDMLVAAASADAAYQTMAQVGVTDAELEATAKEALAAYLDFTATLYAPQACPGLYRDAFDNKGSATKKNTADFMTNTNRHYQAVSRVIYFVGIGTIMEQIGQDFLFIGDESTPANQPKPTYTGKYKLDPNLRDTIQTDWSVFEGEIIERIGDGSPNYDFIMQALSQPALPIVGALLFLGGVALITSGATGLGVCMATVGAILTVGYAAAKCGLFSGSSTPNTTAQSAPEIHNRYLPW